MVIEKKHQTRETGYYGSGPLIDRRRYNNTSSYPQVNPTIITTANICGTSSAQISQLGDSRPPARSVPPYSNILMESNT